MSTHTPGPWFADPFGAVWRRPLHELYEFGGGTAGDRPVAIVERGWFGEGVGGYPVEANARLIAAAPDLLEALEDLLGWQTLAPDDVVSAARAAVNKARVTP